MFRLLLVLISLTPTFSWANDMCATVCSAKLSTYRTYEQSCQDKENPSLAACGQMGPAASAYKKCVKKNGCPSQLRKKSADGDEVVPKNPVDTGTGVTSTDSDAQRGVASTKEEKK